jgi:hypothetical protein
MMNTLLRLAPLSLSLSLVACAAQGAQGAESGSSEPITGQESAATTAAVEGVVVAMAPITSGSPATVAASYRAIFGTGAAGCATIATDDLTFVTVTLACTGPLTASGEIQLALTSPTTFDATVDLKIGGVAIDGSLTVTAPLLPAAEGTLEGELVIDGPRRTLTAEAHASWVKAGECLTYSSSGSVTAEGLARSASATFAVDARTVCRE